MLQKSSSRKTPNDGANVKGNFSHLEPRIERYWTLFVFEFAVKLVGKYEDRVFDERETSFNIGEIPDDEVISGVQTALLHFGKGETSR